VARLRGVEPLARGFEVGDRGLPEEPDASVPSRFTGLRPRPFRSGSAWTARPSTASARAASFRTFASGHPCGSCSPTSLRRSRGAAV